MKQNKIPSNNTVIITVALAILIYALSSCYTQKKAVKQLHKAHNNYPDTTAALLRTWYPIKSTRDTTYHTDTLENIVQVSCDTLKITDTITKDRVKLQPGEKVYIPSREIIKYETIVDVREDSAKIFGLTRQLSAKDVTIKEKDQVIADKDKTIGTKQKWLWWLIIALIISLTGNFILFRRR